MLDSAVTSALASDSASYTPEPAPIQGPATLPSDSGPSTIPDSSSLPPVEDVEEMRRRIQELTRENALLAHAQINMSMIPPPAYEPRPGT
jgi:hypothetical protein